jgi:ribose 5-phosphate isomerase A
MMMSDEYKHAAARAALEHVEPGSVVGVGTGSTTAFFIDGLRATGLAGAVASSEDTRRKLVALGIPVLTLDDIGGYLPLYVDGADQIDHALRMVKGGGGAMTREKVLAAATERFICIVDEAKVVEALGRERIPIEVLPMARAYVRRELEMFGGVAVERPGFVTDNGNVILDVRGLDMSDAEALELTLGALPGVVGTGIFARCRADMALVGSMEGVRTMERLG